MEILILTIFLMWYLLVILEHNIGMNKAKWALFFWTLAWIIIFIYASFTWDIHHSNEMINEILLEIVKLSLFLVAAMTIISYLSERKVLEQMAHKIIPKKIEKTKLLFIIWIFTFFFSALADNLTASLVAITILLSIKNLTKEEIIIFIVFIIFVANAWWVALITWDVTTLMIFLAWKVNIVNLLFLFIPSFIAFISLFLLLKNKLKWEVKVKHNEYKLKSIDKIIFSIFILTIIFIIIGHVLFHIPPSIMFMFGLSLIFILSWFYKKKDNEDNKILAHIHKVEFDAIFFFIWILLMVWSLDYFWLLTKIWELYNIVPSYIATYLIWILSSIVDNIPITAAMLKANLPIQDAWWLNMTYAVWSGWSLLLIGSAAWVIAMSKYPEITFNKYLKFLPQIFIAYTIWFVLTYFTTWIII